MLIREVTSAQDQLNLLKRIIDSTWTAISAEAAAEAAAAAGERPALLATISWILYDLANTAYSMNVVSLYSWYLR